MRQLRQIEGALLEVVHDASGSADDHVDAAAQCRQLDAVALPAVDGQHAYTLHLGRVRLERLADLQGELAGGGEHQCLRGLLVHVEVFEDRQREGGGLAGAGLRLADDIASGQQRGNGRHLNGRGGLIAEVSDRCEHRPGDAELLE
ncbi:hypothetical protein SDC9_167978 [bioreactor metagenome]|uniref:Uncharacterized protein n=1 Tax=bioreactor metagenome TaxID=1076179 RepID=A0A645G468_9ZZZZ